MQPYRREEPRATMTTTTDGKVDAGLADAQVAAYEAMASESALNVPAKTELDAEPDLDVVLKAILFHPHLAAHVKILLMQLVWIGQPLNADDLGKGSGMTPLSILHNLKPMIELGAVRARFVMVDETSGQTVRVFESLPGLLKKLAEVQPETPAATEDDA